MKYPATLALLLLAGAAQAQLLTFDTVYREANILEQGLSPEARRMLTSAQGGIMSKMVRCMAQPPQQQRAAIVLAVNDDGKVPSMWLDPNSSNKPCFHEIKVSEVNFRPLVQPFYTTVEVQLNFSNDGISTGSTEQVH